MDTWVRFLDCPAYADGPVINRPGAARCGLPAVVEYRYPIRSIDGVVDAVKIRCPRGHWFNGPVNALTVASSPSEPVEATALRQPAGRGEGRQ